MAHATKAPAWEWADAAVEKEEWCTTKDPVGWVGKAAQGCTTKAPLLEWAGKTVLDLSGANGTLDAELARRSPSAGKKQLRGASSSSKGMSM